LLIINKKQTRSLRALKSGTGDELKWNQTQYLVTNRSNTDTNTNVKS